MLQNKLMMYFKMYYIVFKALIIKNIYFSLNIYFVKMSIEHHWIILKCNVLLLFNLMRNIFNLLKFFFFLTFIVAKLVIKVP